MKPRTIMLLLFVFTIGVLFTTVPTFAQQASGVKIMWNQPAAELPFVKEWIVYEGNAANPTTELARLQNTGGPLTTNVPINVSGAPGTKVQKYYSVSAVGMNGKETAKTPGTTSGGISYLEFTIPYPDVTAPQSVIFEIVFK